MNIQAEFAELHDMTTNVCGYLNAAPQKEPYEQTGTLPPEYGEGQFSFIQLRDGMELQLSDMIWREDVTFDMGVRYPHLELALNIEGSGCWSAEGQRREISNESGSAQLVYFNDVRVHMEHRKNKRIVQAELRMDARLWQPLFQELGVRLEKSFFCFEDLIGPKLQVLVQQLRSCPYSGSAKRLFLEGKCLELLASFIYEANDGRARKGSSLKTEDIDKIYSARDILLQTLAQPPSLLALSRKISLNDYKLKIGFKEVFGMTVFEFVRQQRMEKARLLLEKGSLNVSQAASLVGYNNFSHFAALFKKTYGVNPSDYVRDAAH
ncbi:helix-turn-helix transcriptional regulator [Paenibacillus elgii]